MVDISESAQNEFVSSGSLKLLPALTTNQTFSQLFMTDEPPALKEVKILRRRWTGVENFLRYVE